MGTSTFDTNGAIVIKLKSLSPESKKAVYNSFAKSPLMLALIKFAEDRQEDKFRNHEAVAHLYNVTRKHDDYARYENRFFKLRKKLYNFLRETPAGNQSIFTSFELQLHEIKQLTILGRYQDAHALLIRLEAALWHNNIFEMLPEVLDLLTHNNQVQRNFEANSAVYKKLDLATNLNHDLQKGKKMARQVYDINLTQGAAYAKAILQKMQRLSINRKTYPRFKLIYNLASATCKLAGGGLDFTPDFKATSRYIHTLQKLHNKYPDMPDYNFIAGYTETQTYLFTNFEVMNHFNAFHFEKAAAIMKRLYAQVMSENSSIKRMRGEVFFSTACKVFSLGNKGRDAVQAARDYLKHLMDLKQTDKVLTAYMELINAHTTMYPADSGLEHAILYQKLEEFITSVKGQPYEFYYLAMATWHKIKLLLIDKRFQEAYTLMNSTDMSGYLMDERLPTEVLSSISLLLQELPAAQHQKALIEQVDKLRRNRMNCRLPQDFGTYNFLEQFLKHAAH